MKLNPDCIRDILLYVEENTSLRHFVSLDPSALPDELNKYEPDEIMYHVKQAELSYLIEEPSYFMDGGCLIKYLLPEGHQFLANIREDTNWNKTKEIAKTAGSNSLDALKQIATGVISSIIKAQLGL